jgi:hypothetical protein
MRLRETGERQMEQLSSLVALGKIAGLGGIALGVVVLLLRPVIRNSFSLPAKQREPFFRLIAIGAFGKDERYVSCG